MRIVQPGLLTTVQDLGRPGYQRSGVTPGGAMDRLALKVANRLVGNPDDAAALEVTLKGPRIEFDRDCLIAICGGELAPKIADVSIPGWRALVVRAGAELYFGAPRWGSRAYIAVAGGIDVPEVLGSRSTYLRAGLGGFEGRPLRAGDELSLGEASALARRILDSAPAETGSLPFALREKRIGAQTIRSLYDGTVIRTVPGCERKLFDELVVKNFYNSVFTISASSDRMGYRLGGKQLDANGRGDMLSRPVVRGSIQVPGDGEPILLMADHQTTGGYPVIADVISADIPLVAQRKPGDKLTFSEVTVDEARDALGQLAKALDEMTALEDAGG